MAVLEFNSNIPPPLRDEKPNLPLRGINKLNPSRDVDGDVSFVNSASNY